MIGSVAEIMQGFDFKLISMGRCPIPRRDTPAILKEPEGNFLETICEQAVSPLEETVAVSKLSEPEKQAAIEKYLPLVKNIAAKLMRSIKRCDYDDLVSDGMFGLLKAVEQFDTARGVKFETYATPVIRGAILNGLRSMDWVPERKRTKTRELQRAMDRLVALHGREGTSEELAQELKLSAQEIYELIADLGTAYLLSLDQPLSSSADEERSFLDTLQDEKSKDPSMEFEFAEQREMLHDSLSGLSERERVIVQLHYYEGVSFEEIAKKLSVSKQRVSQLHTSVLRKLRFSLSKDEDNNETVLPNKRMRVSLKQSPLSLS